MLKHVYSTSSKRSILQKLSMLKFIPGFFALVLAGLSLLRKTMVSTSMVITPQQMDVLIDDTDTESVTQERSFQVNQIEPVSIPSATYASIEVKDDTIHVAQACGDNIVMHKGALLHQDAASEVLNWLKQAAQ